MGTIENLPTLRFPALNIKIFEDESGSKIWDSVRKKQLLLTPEEWVRQHVIRFLIEYKKVPIQMIAVEYQFKIGKLKKRLDVAIYNNQLKPLMLVECKASHVKINQKTIEQILRYNMALEVKYLLITNGKVHYIYEIDYENQKVKPMKEFPDYQSMIEY